MHKTVAYEYYFKGTRKYVHGTTMFESFCRVLKEAGISRFHVKELKFHRELLRNGKIILDAAEQPKELSPETVVTAMTLNAQGQLVFVHLLEDTGSEVTERREDLTARYLGEVKPAGPYAAHGLIQNVENFEALVTALVEFNKQAHMATLNDGGKAYEYRWAFLKGLDADLTANLPARLEVKAAHVGLKKSSEVLSHTLNRLSFNLNGVQQNVMIGFAYFKK